MPTAALRPCTQCGIARVVKGKCPACATQAEQRRGSASSRGYTSQWERFRIQFFNTLVLNGIPPVCGAVLVGGPQTNDSHCKAEGLLTFTSRDGSSLHLDHEPQIQAHERTDMAAVCNALRLQVLCRECHMRKTMRHGDIPWYG